MVVEVGEVVLELAKVNTITRIDMCHGDGSVRSTAQPL